MLYLLIASTLPQISQQLACYYYRVRADEPLSPGNTIARNCSSSIKWCVKIIHKSEAEETTHIDTYLEGRCAYSPDECISSESCTPEAPKTTSAGLSIVDYKCCSKVDLSNKAAVVLPFLTVLVLQFQHLLE